VLKLAKSVKKQQQQQHNDASKVYSQSSRYKC